MLAVLPTSSTTCPQECNSTRIVSNFVCFGLHFPTAMFCQSHCLHMSQMRNLWQIKMRCILIKLTGPSKKIARFWLLTATACGTVHNTPSPKIKVPVSFLRSHQDCRQNTTLTPEELNRMPCRAKSSAQLHRKVWDWFRPVTETLCLANLCPKDGDPHRDSNGIMCKIVYLSPVTESWNQHLLHLMKLFMNLNFLLTMATMDGWQPTFAVRNSGTQVWINVKRPQSNVVDLADSVNIANRLLTKQHMTQCCFWFWKFLKSVIGCCNHAKAAHFHLTGERLDLSQPVLRMTLVWRLVLIQVETGLVLRLNASPSPMLWPSQSQNWPSWCQVSLKTGRNQSCDWLTEPNELTKLTPTHWPNWPNWPNWLNWLNWLKNPTELSKLTKKTNWNDWAGWSDWTGQTDQTVVGPFLSSCASVCRPQWSRHKLTKLTKLTIH